MHNQSSIPLALKVECVQAAERGMTAREIYDTIFLPQHSGMEHRTFRRKLAYWKKQSLAEPDTLYSGTYPGFVAHNATVQVNGKGEVVQAWVKQTIDESQWNELLETIREHTEPVRIQPYAGFGVGMLEIPLFDMHFPLSEHDRTARELLEIINRQGWEEINIIVGQDLFHNDDMRGRTASGRPIEKVDIPKAWELAKTFWFNVIETSIRKAEKVNLIYSVGNHDESLAWAFVQLLKDRYPQLVVDDALKQRKCIYWKNCFIGVTHGAYTKSANQDMRGQFTIEFPEKFAAATVREIHSGHLHHEAEADLYGVMVRRLSRNGKDDQWTDDEGFVGAHKRFMVFEWMPGRLKAIDYI